MDVCFHLVKGAGENGNHHEVRSRQRLGQAVADPVAPVAQSLGPGVHPAADDPVGLGGLPVDVIEGHLAAQGGLNGQIRHKVPGPAPGASADVGQPQVQGLSVFISHGSNLLFA